MRLAVDLSIPSIAVLGGGSVSPVLSANFATNQFNGVTQTFLRGSAATFVNSSLNYQSASSGTLRQTYDQLSAKPLGALIEGSAQNLIHNAVFSGLVNGTIGSGGSYPTNFQLTNSVGSPPAVDVTAITVEGQPGLRMRIHGTPGASGGYLLQFDTETAITVAGGDVMMVLADVALSAGSMTNIADLDLGYVERDAGGAFVALHVASLYAPTFIDGNVQHLASPPVAVGTGVRACPFFNIPLTSGNAVDVTFDISAIGFFKLPNPTSPIYSSGTQLTRSADDLSLTLPGLANAVYMVSGESRLASSGRTLAHLVDGSNNAVRIFQTGFSIQGVVAAAGVEGTPVTLGRCIPGAPLNARLKVAGAAVTASFNGKPAVAITGTGVAYTTAYLGEKSDKSNQWGGTIGLLQVYAGAPSKSSALADLFDDFDRADGAIGTSPSGLPWVQVPVISGVVLASISSGKLIAADSGVSSTAAYSGVDMGSTIKEMRALLSWSSGTVGGSATLISNPAGVTSVSNVTDLSIHIVFKVDSVDVGVWLAGAYTVITSATYAAVMAQDGTQYQVGWELVGNTLTVTPPDGRTFSVTDSRFGTYGGRYGIFEHFWQGASQCRPQFLAAYARSN